MARRRRRPVLLVRGVLEPVRGGVALGPPALGERAEVVGVVADLVEQAGDRGLGGRVVARDRQGAAVGGAGRTGELREVGVVDVVEHLDHGRGRQVRLEQLRRRRGLVLERGDPPVPLGVVVHGVEDDLAGQGGDGHLGESLERHRHHDDVAGLGRLLRGGGPRLRTELADEVREGRRTPAVAHHHVVTGGDRQPRHGAADVAAADESPGGHVVRNGPGRCGFPVPRPRPRRCRPQGPVRTRRPQAAVTASTCRDDPPSVVHVFDTTGLDPLRARLCAVAGDPDADPARAAVEVMAAASAVAAWAEALSLTARRRAAGARDTTSRPPSPRSWAAGTRSRTGEDPATATRSTVSPRWRSRPPSGSPPAPPVTGCTWPTTSPDANPGSSRPWPEGRWACRTHGRSGRRWSP